MGSTLHTQIRLGQRSFVNAGLLALAVASLAFGCLQLRRRQRWLPRAVVTGTMSAFGLHKRR